MKGIERSQKRKRIGKKKKKEKEKKNQKLKKEKIAKKVNKMELVFLEIKGPIRTKKKPWVVRGEKIKQKHRKPDTKYQNR